MSHAQSDSLVALGTNNLASRRHTLGRGHEPPERFINCANGLLDWRTGELRPHSPDVLTTNQIPIPWTPGATARTVERFLKEVLPEDAISLVEELIGYALYPGNPFRKAVMLLGPGGNG